MISYTQNNDLLAVVSIDPIRKTQGNNEMRGPPRRNTLYTQWTNVYNFEIYTSSTISEILALKNNCKKR